MIFSNVKIIRSNTLKSAKFGLLMSSIAISVFMLISFSSVAGEKINKSLLTDDTSKTKICNDRGSIKVLAWDKDEVMVIGEIDDLAEGFIFEKKGNDILIEVKLSAKHAHGQNNGKGSKLEIWLPKEHNLQFDGIATDIDVKGLDGDVKINSVSGDIVASQLSGNLKIKNISGKNELSNLSGDIDVAVVSGNLDVNVSSKKINVKGVSSNISVTTNEIEMVNLFNVSGNTKLSGKIAEEGSITLENISGESYFFYKDAIDAKVSIITGPDGSIINRVKSIEKEETHLNTQQQYFVEGQGMGTITMQTVNGKVGLKDFKDINKRK